MNPRQIAQQLVNKPPIRLYLVQALQTKQPARYPVSVYFNVWPSPSDTELAVGQVNGQISPWGPSLLVGSVDSYLQRRAPQGAVQNCTTRAQVSLPLFEWRVHFLPHRAACCRRRIAGCQQGGSDLSAFFPTPGLRQCWIARPGGQRALVLFDSGVGADKKRKGLHLLSAGRLKLHTSSSIVAGPPRLCPRRDRFWVGGVASSDRAIWLTNPDPFRRSNSVPCRQTLHAHSICRSIAISARLMPWK